MSATAEIMRGAAALRRHDPAVSLMSPCMMTWGGRCIGVPSDC